MNTSVETKQWYSIPTSIFNNFFLLLSEMGKQVSDYQCNPLMYCMVFQQCMISGLGSSEIYIYQRHKRLKLCHLATIVFNKCSLVLRDLNSLSSEMKESDCCFKVPSTNSSKFVPQANLKS